MDLDPAQSQFDPEDQEHEQRPQAQAEPEIPPPAPGEVKSKVFEAAFIQQAGSQIDAGRDRQSRDQDLEQPSQGKVPGGIGQEGEQGSEQQVGCLESGQDDDHQDRLPR